MNIILHDLSIAYKTWGNPSNPCVLALHGWLDNANSFDLIAELLRSHYYIIALDLPGHGHSDHLPPSSHYHFTDGIFLVIEFMNSLGLDKVHLLGHSMGACLASLIAGVAATRLMSLSLIEGLGPFTHPAETACQQFSDYLEFIQQSATLKKFKGYESLEKAAAMRAIKGYVSVDLALRLCERALVEKQGLFYWKHDRRLLAPSPLKMTEEQVLSCLKQIRVKTLLLWASSGFSFDSHIMQERIRVIPNLVSQRFEGGHHIHMEQPQEIARRLGDFYR
jgi:pimeloyl-ACP methyl ester carboxylesterase